MSTEPAPASRPPIKRLAIALGVGLGVLATLAAILLGTHRKGPAPAHGMPVPTVQKPRVIARVGDVAITDAQVARFQLVRELTQGVTGFQQALEEVERRTLWALAARDQGLAVTEVEVRQEVFRKRTIMGALAMVVSPSGPRPPVPRLGAVSQSPLDRAEQALTEKGLTGDDLLAESTEDLLASKARQRLVYDAIEIPQQDLLDAYAREPKAVLPQGKAPAPDEATLNRLRQRLRRERGEARLKQELDVLGAKWKVVPVSS